MDINQAPVGQYLKIFSCGSTYYGEDPTSIDSLIEALGEYTLNPVFEKYGNFIQKNPLKLKFLITKNGDKIVDRDENFQNITDGPLYPNRDVTTFFGNFSDISHVFNIHTDRQDIIEKLSKAIKENLGSLRYQMARRA